MMLEICFHFKMTGFREEEKHKIVLENRICYEIGRTFPYSPFSPFRGCFLLRKSFIRTGLSPTPAGARTSNSFLTSL